MSAYQYYEFRAIDQPLSSEQIAEVRSCSSRASITPYSFANTYNFGDFGGRPEVFMERYFDAHLYVSHWGTYQLMFRFPKAVLGFAELEPYCIEPVVDYTQTDDLTIVSIMSSDEDGGGSDYVDGEGWLERLVPLREAVLEGDMRLLYLGWLTGVESMDVLDEDREPPIPPGLGETDSPLTAFIELFGLNQDLVAAAAEDSEALEDTRVTHQEYQEWVAQLCPRRKDCMLVQTLQEGPAAVREIRRQALKELRPTQENDPNTRRTAAFLRQRAEEVRQERLQRERKERARQKAIEEREKAAQRREFLESIAGREEQLWDQVTTLADRKRASAYAEAVQLLVDLRDLAEISGEQSLFRQRLGQFYRSCSNRPALRSRMDKEGLRG